MKKPGPEVEGWANRATWNVALWVKTDVALRRAAEAFMRTPRGKKSQTPYKTFVADWGLADQRTPDGFPYMGTKLSYRQLNELMRGLEA